MRQVQQWKTHLDAVRKNTRVGVAMARLYLALHTLR